MRREHPSHVLPESALLSEPKRYIKRIKINGRPKKEKEGKRCEVKQREEEKEREKADETPKRGSKKKKTPKSNHKRSKRGLRRKEKSDLEVEATGQPTVLGDIRRS